MYYMYTDAELCNCSSIEHTILFEYAVVARPTGN